MEAYFDNSATTKCSPKAAELVMKVLTEDYGNTFFSPSERSRSGGVYQRSEKSHL